MTWHNTSRQSRGYGAEWQRTRERILKRDKHLCQCEYCKADNRIKVATEVDHIVSRAKAKLLGWSREATEADSNLRAINHDCHKRKGIEETGRKFKPRQRIGLDGWPITTPGGDI